MKRFLKPFISVALVFALLFSVALPAKAAGTSQTLQSISFVTIIGEKFQYSVDIQEGETPTFGSANASIASVSLVSKTKTTARFEITTKGLGNTSIWVKSNSGKELYYTVNLSVIDGIGLLKMDTTSYHMAPGNIYDFKVTSTINAAPVLSDSRAGTIVQLTKRPNGNYRLTAKKAGTTYITASIGNARVSMKIVVEKGAKAYGSSGYNKSILTKENSIVIEAEGNSNVSSTYSTTINGKKVSGKLYPDEAKEVFNLVNAERSKVGLKALTWNTSMESAAKLRSAEISVKWSHERPNGTSCVTAHPQMKGENIAYGQSSLTPSNIMASWMNSQGHKTNILYKGYTGLTVSCLEIDGKKYWVQSFS